MNAPMSALSQAQIGARSSGGRAMNSSLDRARSSVVNSTLIVLSAIFELPNIMAVI